jgi:hypothetical protein
MAQTWLGRTCPEAMTVWPPVRLDWPQVYVKHWAATKAFRGLARGWPHMAR